MTVVSKDQIIGTGDKAASGSEKSENKVQYLIGNVTLTQGPNVTKGDKLIYDLNTNQAAVNGHVRSMFQPGAAGPETQKSQGRRSRRAPQSPIAR